MPDEIIIEIKDQELIEALINLSKKELLGEDELVYEVVGNNIDDAYMLGHDHGQVLLAKHIVKHIKQ